MPKKKHPPWLLAALVKMDEKVEKKKKLVSGDVILLSLLDGPSS
jgi:ribosome-associated protein YbcJ (S4-like RNA binding protein)